MSWPPETNTYATEREYNFRELSRLFATTSRHALTLADLVPEPIASHVSQIGEFAEIAHGSLNPAFIFKNKSKLSQPGFPLELSPAISEEGTVLTETFHGSCGYLQGYVALRPSQRQVVLAFSGTSNPRLGVHNTMAWHSSYHAAGPTLVGSNQWRVHTGFQKVYIGIRQQGFAALSRALADAQNRIEFQGGPMTIVVTGHSLGGAMSYLATLELLQSQSYEPDSNLAIPENTSLVLAVFGCPRVGNAALVKHFREMETSYHNAANGRVMETYSVIGYMDGVPALPMASFGYSHFCSHPFYLFHGDLYAIPTTECEHTHFKVIRDASLGEPRFARGGHNYYNVRDMERLQRRMKLIQTDAEKKEGEWESLYRAREAEERVAWETKCTGKLK